MTSLNHNYVCPKVDGCIEQVKGILEDNIQDITLQHNPFIDADNIPEELQLNIKYNVDNTLDYIKDEFEELRSEFEDMRKNAEHQLSDLQSTIDDLESELIDLRD